MTQASSRPLCGHPTNDGESCESPIGLCKDCGHCLAHCEHRATQRRQARAKGGRISTAKRGGGRPLDVSLPETDALPRPQTIQECALWLSTLAWAVSVGRLSPDRADKSRLAVKDLRDLLLKDQDKRIDELQRTIERLQKARKDGR